MELVFEIPAIRFVLGEIVDDRMQVSDDEPEFFVVRMQERNCGNLSEVLHLVLDAQRLLNEILMAITGDFLVEVLKNGRDEDQTEVFMRWFNLELLEHLGQER